VRGGRVLLGGTRPPCVVVLEPYTDRHPAPTSSPACTAARRRSIDRVVHLGVGRGGSLHAAAVIRPPRPGYKRAHRGVAGRGSGPHTPSAGTAATDSHLSAPTPNAALLTALGFLRSGFDWVATASNGHWKQQSAREFARPFLLENARVHHITLDPGEEILRQRIAQCSKATGQAVDDQHAAGSVDMLLQVRQELGTWTHVVDNGRLTPEATVRAIYDATDRGHGLMHP
jgi:hypothetical protein